MFHYSANHHREASPHVAPRRRRSTQHLCGHVLTLTPNAPRYGASMRRRRPTHLARRHTANWHAVAVELQPWLLYQLLAPDEHYTRTLNANTRTCCHVDKNHMHTYMCYGGKQSNMLWKQAITYVCRKRIEILVLPHTAFSYFLSLLLQSNYLITSPFKDYVTC